MPERFLCDYVYYSDKRIEISELICQDKAEALEWLAETYLELHLDASEQPDLIRLRLEDDIIAEWETHFDSVL